MRPRLALVTAQEALGLDQDLDPLLKALRDLGADAEAVVWDAAVDWSTFDLALLRSAWDYVPRLPEFLHWCEATSHRTRLLNPLEVVRWNTDKHYLLDLHRAGVPVVPTRFVEPGENPEGALETFLHRGEFSVGHPIPFEEFVLKPAIGAGSKDAARYHGEEAATARAHLARLLGEGRSVMLQPYLASVDTRGETAMLMFEGGFSHAIRKGPLLRRGAGLVEGLFAPEEITPRIPTPEEQAVAGAALRAMPFPALLYARVDLIEDEDGRPVVLELELTEPSLFFAQGPGSADRFAQAVLRRLRA
jgi:glutathione synthase/RimK-type ligase-like ATP-grasp enzyme